MSTRKKGKNASFKANVGLISILIGFICLVAGKPMVGDPTITDITPLSIILATVFIVTGVLSGYKNFGSLLEGEEDPEF